MMTALPLIVIGVIIIVLHVKQLQTIVYYVKEYSEIMPLLARNMINF